MTNVLVGKKGRSVEVFGTAAVDERRVLIDSVER